MSTTHLPPISQVSYTGEDGNGLIKRTSHTHVNPVPSQSCEGLVGLTTKTYRLKADDEVCTIPVKLRSGKCRAPVCILGEDIVYSPNKYRETEGIKEIKLKELSVNQCQELGMTDTQLIRLKTMIRKAFIAALLLIRNLILCVISTLL